MPGRVDLWPALETEKAGEEPAWWEPVDVMPPASADARLAGAIAAEIDRMLRAGVVLPQARGGPRPVRPGDFLILVRRRSALFHRIIAECKARGLPMAGADRMNLGAEIAVRDLTALLSFLATPEDDLSLAAVLRSPLGGWSEAQLFALAHGRRGFLWEALRGREDGARTRAWLGDLRDAADFLRPYEILERALVRHDGRRLLLARLGPEAEEGIDALLAQALAYETTEVPSLTGFLGWLAAGEVEVKRRPDGAGDRIRVMTVHGAKGLEAPIVILPDTAERKGGREGALTRAGGDGPALWKTARDAAPPLLAAALEAEAAARAEEDARLLYVAMTRAECWLIAAAAGSVGTPECWHARLRAGLEAAGAAAFDSPLGAGLRLQHGDWPEAAGTADGAAPEPPAVLPDWMHRAPPPVDQPPPPLRPSDLGGAKVVPGEAAGAAEEAAALRRGRRLHLLLEHLPLWPEADWEARAADLLAAEAAEAEEAAPGADVAGLLAEAGAILRAPELAFLFAPDTLAEVEIAAGFGSRRLTGVIDRLVVAPDRVLAVDWKSNALVPARPEDVPEGLLRQMAAYGVALRQIWPGRRVELALLWTRGARLMPLPDALLEAAGARALAEAAAIDPAPPRP
jgi:ATP-dependent helicase/nuclease subunit A